jgi:hypothetical protein
VWKGGDTYDFLAWLKHNLLHREFRISVYEIRKVLTRVRCIRLISNVIVFSHYKLILTHPHLIKHR